MADSSLIDRQHATTTPDATDADVAALSTEPLCAVAGTGLPIPLVTGGTLPYANLDYAASAPAAAAVVEHIATALPFYASVHRGAGYASQVSTALLENSR